MLMFSLICKSGPARLALLGGLTLAAAACGDGPTNDDLGQAFGRADSSITSVGDAGPGAVPSTGTTAGTSSSANPPGVVGGTTGGGSRNDASLPLGDGGVSIAPPVG